MIDKPKLPPLLQEAFEVMRAAPPSLDTDVYERLVLTSQAISLDRAARALELIARDGIGNVVQGLKLSNEDIAAVIASREERNK
jgi:hypothetical protein